MLTYALWTLSLGRFHLRHDRFPRIHHGHQGTGRRLRRGELVLRAERRAVASRRFCLPVTRFVRLFAPAFQYDVTEESFFQNTLNFNNFSSRVMADQLRKTPNKDQSEDTSRAISHIAEFDMGGQITLQSGWKNATAPLCCVVAGGA